MARDPNNKEKPHILWDIVFLLEISVSMGANLGSMINKTFPNWFLVLCEFILLTYVTFDFFKKGVKRYKADMAKLKKQ